MPRTLPLGVDIGSTRIRIAEAVATPRGPRIRAVVVREASGDVGDPEYVATLLEDAIRELGTKERRCVAALGQPHAVLRTVRLPRMTSLERERAARFEAQRYGDFAAGESLVRIHPIDVAANSWAIGVAKSDSVKARVATLRGARLRPVAIDHEACALVRALPGFDAIIDVGYGRASLHLSSPGAPATLQTFSGGSDVTRAIERELSIDTRSAEKRKRILGTAGAGERARKALSLDIAALIQAARQSAEIAHVALVGNAARLPGFASDLERATGVHCETPVSELLQTEHYPGDVVRSGAPDWTLAAGLAAWKPR